MQTNIATIVNVILFIDNTIKIANTQFVAIYTECRQNVDINSQTKNWQLPPKLPNLNHPQDVFSKLTDLSLHAEGATNNT